MKIGSMIVFSLTAATFLFGQQKKELEVKKTYFPITEDFSKGKQMAKAYHKPILLIFSGSDWCIYSQKLFEKILSTEEFAEEVKKEFIFVQVDFPELNRNLCKEIIEENFHLKEFFHVKDFPTLVLLDYELEEVCRVGFSEEIGAEYGKRLMNLWKKYEQIKEELAHPIRMSFTQLHQKYQDAKEIGSLYLVKKILELGMKTDKENFFHFQMYQMGSESEKKSLREKILGNSVENKELIKFKLDLLDYLDLASDKKKEAIVAMAKSLNSLKEEGVKSSSIGLHLDEWLDQELKGQR